MAEERICVKLKIHRFQLEFQPLTSMTLLFAVSMKYLTFLILMNFVFCSRTYATPHFPSLQIGVILLRWKQLYWRLAHTIPQGLIPLHLPGGFCSFPVVAAALSTVSLKVKLTELSLTAVPSPEECKVSIKLIPRLEYFSVLNRRQLSPESSPSLFSSRLLLSDYHNELRLLSINRPTEPSLSFTYRLWRVKTSQNIFQSAGVDDKKLMKYFFFSLFHR